MATQLIVALDFDNEESALAMVDKINPTHCALKVGSELFTRLGSPFIRKLINQGYRVFLDLKFHDIPTTVARACAVTAEMGVWMVNLHAFGGLAMMRAARNALESYGNQRPLLIAVTVLTSMNSHQLAELGVDFSVAHQVNRLAQFTQEAGLDGIVCSALEVPIVKQLCGANFLTVTPGIRLEEDSNDDQSRIVTPKDAASMGSDFLVIGRPITRSPRPETVINTILDNIRLSIK